MGFGGVSFGNCMIPPANQFYSNDPPQKGYFGGLTPPPPPAPTTKVISGVLYCKKLKEKGERSLLPISTKVATDLSLNHSNSRKITL